MTGIIDIGGGLRGIYTSGIYDYLIDNGIDIEYCMGVSSGCANLITYVAGQRGRTRRFYEEYSFDKEYMGVGSYLKNGMLINLDYIYSEITNSTGKDPLDYETIRTSSKQFHTVLTDAKTAKPVYFTKDALSQDNYTLLKASCALPAACRKPIEFEGNRYFDGGLSDPMPFEKAFADGCDRLIVLITLPIDYRKDPISPFLTNILIHKYPEIKKRILISHDTYNKGIEALLELERQGKIFIVYPRECFGVNTVTRDKEGLAKLYQLGYEDGRKIEEYLSKDKTDMNA